MTKPVGWGVPLVCGGIILEISQCSNNYKSNMKKYMTIFSNRWAPILVTLVVLAGLIVFFINWQSCSTWICAHEALAACFIASAVMIVGWVWALRTLTSMKHTRHVEILLEMGRYWDGDMGRGIWSQIAEKASSEEFAQTMENYKENKPEDYHRLISFANFFEDMGFLAKENYIEKKKILSIYTMPILRTYEKYKDWVEKLQKIEEEAGYKPQAYSYFKWLVDEAKKYNKKK
ncbi:hypothetical protein ACFLVP_01560 [Chloroflexota bacterium]